MKTESTIKKLSAVGFYYKGIELIIKDREDVENLQGFMEFIVATAIQNCNVNFTLYQDTLNQRAVDLKGCKDKRKNEPAAIIQWSEHIYTLVKYGILKEDDKNGVKYFHDTIVIQHVNIR